MSVFAHHASTPVRKVESAPALARHVLALALLWAVAVLALVVATAETTGPERVPAQTEAPEAAAVMPLGA